LLILPNVVKEMPRETNTAAHSNCQIYRNIPLFARTTSNNKLISELDEIGERYAQTPTTA